MAIPILFGIAAAVTGVTGAVKGVKGAIDTKEANDVQDRAERILKRAQRSVEDTKESTNLSIQNLGETKLKVCAKQINDFVDSFSKIKVIELEDSIGLDELKKLNITPESIQNMKKTAVGAIDVLGGGIAGVGAGVLLGWGTYGGVMALGTASTGAAIGGLSGVAATNATLAWLGGGALAAGGGGMALGTMVLGGIIAGPALLVAGGIFGAKAKEKLNNAYSNLSEAKRIVAEIETAESELKIIENNANQLNNLIKKLAEMLDRANFGLKQVVDSEVNWNKYSKAEKNIVASAMKTAQVVKTIIDVPLLTKDGVLTKDVQNVLKEHEISLK
ncbi:MAG: transrane protein [Massilibacillus sp.]|jgi:uncharacterized FlaG/YvyC family protein|nr:transrane protein [Massilibacillus sp.]